mgnify:FL=1
MPPNTPNDAESAKLDLKNAKAYQKVLAEARKEAAAIAEENIRTHKAQGISVSHAERLRI